MNQTSQVTQSPGGMSFYTYLPMIHIVLAIVATVRCFRGEARGIALILWLLLVWLLPIFGPVIALALVRRGAPHTT
jgi:hypothetical protein